MMRCYRVVTFLGTSLGIALGAALAASPAAVADPDPIDDAWPYGGVTLPGYPGPHHFDTTGTDVTYLHHPDLSADPDDIPAGDEWYTIHRTISTYPILGSYTHNEVTALLDDSASFPHVGTVADHLGLFPIPVPVAGEVVAAPLIANTYLDDPALGFADKFTVFTVLDNTYLSDSAGVKDVFSVFGLPITLFEFPATDPGAAASDPGDGFAQLLTEFTNAFPGPDLF
jgi:hypothetical protein